MNVPLKPVCRCRIDVHHHLIPPAYLEATASRRRERYPAWSPEQSLEDMEKNGIERSISSITQPGVWFEDVELGRKTSRLFNDYARDLDAKHPGKFGLFAALPLPDVEGSLKEIEYALDQLKCEGIGLMTSYAGKWLGDPAFWPVLEELNRRKAVVYTHPLLLECCRGLQPYLNPSTIEFATDTTRTIASLLFEGAAGRFPDIRWIFSHGGGTMPFLLSRFTRAEAALPPEERAKKFPDGLLATIRRFHYDTAQANHKGALDAVLHVTDVSQVLFGTDYPFRPGKEVVDGLESYGFADADLTAIERGNAIRMMPTLARR